MVPEKLEVEPCPKLNAKGSQKQAGLVITRVYVDRPCRVVRDALELTKRLYSRYLWVDEYCIPADARQRQMHIDQMDKIYEGAVLTICALSGANKHVGLPGINTKLLVSPQLFVDINSTRIMATMFSSFLQEIERSPWNQRAWTLRKHAYPDLQFASQTHQSAWYVEMGSSTTPLTV
jgi:hypothetical protein